MKKFVCVCFLYHSNEIIPPSSSPPISMSANTLVDPRTFLFWVCYSFVGNSCKKTSFFLISLQIFTSGDLLKETVNLKGILSYVSRSVNELLLCKSENQTTSHLGEVEWPHVLLLECSSIKAGSPPNTTSQSGTFPLGGAWADTCMFIRGMNKRLSICGDLSLSFYIFFLPFPYLGFTPSPFAPNSRVPFQVWS